MNTRNKTIPVAVYPDGRTFRIRKSHGVWMWRHDSGSYPFSAAVENVEREGGRVERHPNPNYRPDPLPHFSRLMRSFGL